MNTNWIWHNAVPDALCDIILEERKQLVETEGLVVGDNLSPVYRKSKIAWLPTGHWLEGTLINFAMNANAQNNWNFEVAVAENVQLTRYEKDSYYNWHNDALMLDSPYIRKVSVVLLLNDKSEFEGGEFEFDGGDIIELNKGSLLAFPSFLNHRVKPVAKGERHSAVCWVNGIRK